MATVVFGDFKWDERRAASNLRKYHVTFEEASTVFADAGYLLIPNFASPDRFHAIGLSAFARVLTVVHVERGPRLRIISARKATSHEKKRTRAAADRGPSKRSLRDIPEVDFSRGVRPHRYARLQSGYKYQVFVDPETFEFFGSAEAVNEALQFLVKAAARASRSRSHRAA